MIICIPVIVQIYWQKGYNKQKQEQQGKIPKELEVELDPSPKLPEFICRAAIRNLGAFTRLLVVIHETHFTGSLFRLLPIWLFKNLNFLTGEDTGEHF